MMRIAPALMLALGLASFGCGGKQPPPPETKPAEPTKEPPPAADAASKPEDAAAQPAADAAAAAPVTAQARVDMYLKCWGHFNASAWDDFKACFTPDFTDDMVGSGMPPSKGWDEFKATRVDVFKTAFPDMAGTSQMVFQVGDHTIGVHLLKGTHSGPLKTPAGDIPATQKSIGLLALHHVEWQQGGMVVARQALVFDMGTLLGQIGVSPNPHRAEIVTGADETLTVISKDDAAEKAIRAAYDKQVVNFSKHDFAAVMADVHDNVVWAEQALPADLGDKAEVEAHFRGMHGAFPDVSLTPTWVGVAGEFVIAAGSFKGTNTGEYPAMKIPATGKALDLQFYEIQKWEEGKVADAWVFFNGMQFAGQLGLLPPPPGP